jgi:hypothetical protein
LGQPAGHSLVLATKAKGPMMRINVERAEGDHPNRAVFVDIHDPKYVSVAIQDDGIWVNINEQCMFRVENIKQLHIEDRRGQ